LKLKYDETLSNFAFNSNLRHYTLAVTGAAALSSTLAVTGAAALSSTLGVVGITTLADDLLMPENTAALTHTGTTGLAITSNSGYVDVEDIRFTGAAIGVSGTPTVVTVASGGAAVTGTLSASGASTLVALTAGATTVTSTLSVAGRDIHSSTSQLNLSRFRHKSTP
jgi:hypothetical protein